MKNERTKRERRTRADKNRERTERKRTLRGRDVGPAVKYGMERSHSVGEHLCL